MGTKGLVVYLLTCFSVAILSTSLLFNNHPRDGQLKYPSFLSSSLNSPPILGLHGFQNEASNSTRVWPELEFSWKTVSITVIGFLGSAFGTVGGVGGGGIFVPMLNLIVGFDTKSAAALSKCMIMGASASSVWYNLRVPHPCKEVPILDYDLALLFQPMLMLGITIGVSLSVVFPYWLITVLIIILFLGTSSRSFFRGIEMWKEETIVHTEMDAQKKAPFNSHGELLIEPLISREVKSDLEILKFNLRWNKIFVLLTVWVCFVLLQIVKCLFTKLHLATIGITYKFLPQNDTTVCSLWYWVLNILQFPVAFVVFGYEAVKLHRESRKRRIVGNNEKVCEALIEWSVLEITFCALCGVLGGTVGGLLGSGGGFILGPLLLELGVIPQVASATATFVMMYSSSLSVVEFYFLDRFPIPYALYLIAVSVLAGFWGQCIVRKLIAILRRASIIVFILSAVIVASALTMGVVGVEKSIKMIHNNEYMGFLSFCSTG